MLRCWLSAAVVLVAGTGLRADPPLFAADRPGPALPGGMVVSQHVSLKPELAGPAAEASGSDNNCATCARGAHVGGAFHCVWDWLTVKTYRPGHPAFEPTDYQP